MEKKTILIKAGFISRIFMITFMLLLILTFVQLSILEISGLFPVMHTSSNHVQQAQNHPLDRQYRIERSGKLFLPDGTIHLAYTDYQLPYDQRKMIYDLNDNLVWQGNEDELPGNYLKWPQTREYQLNVYILRRRNNIYPDPRRNILVPVTKGLNLESLWRYEDSGGYFAGFDTKGKRIGYVGSEGFAQEISQVKSLEQPKGLITWVPLEGDGPLMLWQTEQSIYQIDFTKQSVDLLFQLPDEKISNIKINGWMELAKEGEFYIDKQIYRPMILCKTDKGSFYVILRNPEETIKINFPEDWKALTGDVAVSATREKIYLGAIDSSTNPPKEILQNPDPDVYATWFQQRRNEPIKISDRLYEVDSAGNMTLLNRFEWTTRPRQTTQIIDPMVKLRLFLSKASPVAYDVFFQILFGFFRDQLIRHPELSDFVREFIRFSPNSNPYSYMLSLLLAGFVFFHAWPRRKSMVSLVGWVIFAFLFNIVGLLVYLALNFTPTIKCHSCNKRRGLNMPQCPHCRAELSVAGPGRLSIITEA